MKKKNKIYKKQTKFFSLFFLLYSNSNLNKRLYFNLRKDIWVTGPDPVVPELKYLIVTLSVL
ncbi:hypothetical protein DEU39_1520 [Chryseobacterium sp. AG363]|nr:hypothetical protein DEU39_1520 [Chryseobacterium sp. AG363]